MSFLSSLANLEPLFLLVFFLVFLYFLVVVILNLEEKNLNADFGHDTVGCVVFIVLAVDVYAGGGF